MKKIILSAFILISFFAFPLFSHASYIIHLKGGGQFITSKYWEEDGQITFFVRGGTMGIEKDTVKVIEKSKIHADDYQTNQSKQIIPKVTPALEKTIKEETVPHANVTTVPEANAKEEKVDLKAYREKMDKLKADINKTLTRMRKATASKDQIAMDGAIEENRRISAEMWKLTDELKAKNKGKLPDDWWEGVGREESATP
ncbi:MAG: Uncharacterized protein FD159_1379 [Syntrophaceae bacterium]|nr:MAG: Uncharacterized protein FD159_1379 [Syntrophaceae bacterium]